MALSSAVAGTMQGFVIHLLDFDVLSVTSPSSVQGPYKDVEVRSPVQCGPLHPLPCLPPPPQEGHVVPLEHFAHRGCGQGSSVAPQPI